MNSLNRFAMPLMAALATFAANAETAPALPPPPEAFARQLVAALNARDLEAVKAITHPDTRKCMTPQKADYYGWRLWKDGSRRHTIPAKYKLRMEQPVNVEQAEIAMTAANFTPQHWPVQPDAAMYVIYNSAPLSVNEVLFEVTVKDGNAQLVMECPTEFGMGKFAEKQAADKVQDAKLRQSWKDASAADKAKLRDFSKQAKKIDGMNFAEKALHLNAAEALTLMDKIEYADMP